MDADEREKRRQPLFQKLVRCQKRLARLEELSAPEVIIENDKRMIAETREALIALGWDGGPFRIRHTPYRHDETTIRSAPEVATRALVLAAASDRALMSSDGDDEPDRIRTLRDWIRFADGAMTDGEKKMLDLAPGAAIDPQRIADKSWGIEAAAMLAWCLGLHELTPFDAMCSPSKVKKSLSFLEPGAADWARKQSLRPAAELLDAFDRMFALHWRITDFDHRPQRTNFTAMGERAPFWFGPLAVDGLPLIEDDLAISGAPIFSADPTKIADARSVIVERRKAIGWLCDRTIPDYSETPLDT